MSEVTQSIRAEASLAWSVISKDNLQDWNRTVVPDGLTVTFGWQVNRFNVRCIDKAEARILVEYSGTTKFFSWTSRGGIEALEMLLTHVWDRPLYIDQSLRLEESKQGNWPEALTSFLASIPVIKGYYNKARSSKD